MNYLVRPGGAFRSAPATRLAVAAYWPAGADLPETRFVSPPRSFDPRRLDVAAFSLAEGHLEGEWPLAELGRLQQDALPLASDSPAQSVTWSAQGERRVVPGREPEIRLRLHASSALRVCCQRCLQPMTVTLDVRPTLRFVHGEDQAQRLDEESDEDVLALSTALDLRELTEDELILALPLVPRHEVCPQALPLPTDDSQASDSNSEAHPFAVLASIRRGAGGGKQS
jgi:uncharacterized protein